MGLRGPGARPKPKIIDHAVHDHGDPPWKADGLSRSDRVVAFLESLPITAGKLAGTTMTIRPWQREFIDAVYRVDDDGNRPVRTAVLSMARKNGKTQLAAGLALCHLLGPEAEQRGECYSAALTKDQASKLFLEMVAILNAFPPLGDRCNVQRFTKTIEVLNGDGAGSIYVALSADAGSKMGLSPSFVVYDELGSAPGRDLYDALDTATGARENPLMICISTQAPADFHVFSELIDYGLRVNSGDVDDPSFHLTLYRAPEDADPWDRASWIAANPALADFRSLEDVERQAAQARLVPSKESAFRNLILNQRISATARFINQREWALCAGAVDLQALPGRECFAGLDLSGGRDLTAFVMVFPRDDRGFDAVAKFYMPEAGIEERSNEDRVPYALWAKQGLITLIPGSTIDPAFVAHDVAEAAATYDLKAVAYDRWRINDFKRELDELGCTVPLEAFGQGFRDMSPAVDTLERQVAEKLLRHGGNPVLTMCAANATVTRDPAGGRKLDKAKSTGRIDGLIGLAMALQTAGRFEGPAIYNGLGPLWV